MKKKTLKKFPDLTLDDRQIIRLALTSAADQCAGIASHPSVIRTVRMAAHQQMAKMQELTKKVLPE